MDKHSFSKKVIFASLSTSLAITPMISTPFVEKVHAESTDLSGLQNYFNQISNNLRGFEKDYITGLKEDLENDEIVSSEDWNTYINKSSNDSLKDNKALAKKTIKDLMDIFYSSLNGTSEGTFQEEIDSYIGENGSELNTLLGENYENVINYLFDYVQTYHQELNAEIEESGPAALVTQHQYPEVFAEVIKDRTDNVFENESVFTSALGLTVDELFEIKDDLKVKIDYDQKLRDILGSTLVRSKQGRIQINGQDIDNLSSPVLKNNNNLTLDLGEYSDEASSVLDDVKWKVNNSRWSEAGNTASISINNSNGNVTGIDSSEDNDYVYVTAQFSDDEESVTIPILSEKIQVDYVATTNPGTDPDPDPDPEPNPGTSDPDPEDEEPAEEPGDETGDSGEDTNPEDDVDLDVDPADGEVIVNNEAVTVTKEENEEGKTVVKVELNAEEVAKGLADKTPEQVKSIRIQVNKDSAEDIAEVAIPSGALNAVKDKNADAVVEVATEGASYKLPVNEVNTDELAKEFSEQLQVEMGDDTVELTSDDVEISIQINEVAEDDEQVSENVTNNNLRPVSKVIEFKIEARTKDGSVRKEIKRFKKYVEREIEGEKEFDMTHSTAVRLNDNGTFTSVPTLFEGTTATVKSMSNSKYTIVENDKTFSDIENTWNQETIEKLASKYIIQGKLDGTYAPKEYIKRSEFTTLISRALGLVDEEADFEGMFPDVKKGKWYANHVEAAVDAGIIQGREDGTFDPDSYVTRNETAAMIKRAMDFVSYDKSELNQDKEVTKYEDYDQIAKWARDNVEVLLQAEIMSGRGNGNFDPYGDINRAEMAKVLDEFLSFVKLING